MTESPHAADNQPPLLDVMASLKVLWQRRVLIVAVTLALVSVAVLYLAVTRPVYTAKAVVLVDPRDNHTTDSDDVLPGLGSDSAAIASQLAVIKSQEVLGAVFETEDIAADPEFAGGGGLVGSLLAVVGGSKQASEQQIFERFASHLEVEREGLTYVLNVSFKSPDPQKAARIVNAIVERYVGKQVTEKSDANAAVTDMLDERIGDLQRAVTEAEQAVEAFKVENRIFDSGAGGTIMQNQIDQLNAQLFAAQDLARQAASRYEQAATAGRTPKALVDLAGSEPSTAAKLRDEYNLRSTAYASGQAVYGAKHPTLIKLGAEVARVEALMIRELERLTLELKASRDLAAANVAKIEADIATLRAQSNVSNQRAVELRQLERNAEASRAVLEQFLKRSEETYQLQTLQFSDARIISGATAPAQATWPQPTLVLALGGILGVMLGSASALLLGPVLAGAGQARQWPLRALVQQWRVPAAAPVPAVGQPATMPVAAPPAPAPAAAPTLPVLGTLRTRFRTPPPVPSRGEVDAAKLEVSAYPQSPFALQIATLVSRVLATLDVKKSPHVLLVSEPVRSFEKCRLGYNLAAALHRVGASVVVVDLDPLAAQGGVTGRSGSSVLLQAMSGKLPLAAAFTKDAPSQVPTIMDGSEAVWNEVQVRRLIDMLAEQFSFILVIARPLADPGYSAALAAAADQQIVAIGQGETAQMPAAAPGRSAVVIEHGLEEPRLRPAVRRTPEVRAAVSEIRGRNRYAELT